MASPNRKRCAPNVRWVRVWRVWHWRAKRYIYRKDGLPFVFPVFGK
jgi:hypothetical protein